MRRAAKDISRRKFLAGSLPSTLWALTTGATALAQMSRPAEASHVMASPITAIAFFRDGQRFVVGSQAGVQIRSWPSLGLEQELALDAIHVHDLVLSPDGQQLLVVGGRPAEFGIVKCLQAAELTELSRYDVASEPAYAARWTADGTRFFTAGGDNHVRAWTPNQATALFQLGDHSRPVTSLVCLSDSRHLISAGHDQSLRVWDFKERTLRRRMDHHTAGVTDLAERPKAQSLPMIASAAQDRTVRFWQPTIGRLVRFLRLDAQPLCLDWTCDGGLLVVGCSDGVVRVVNPDTVQIVQSFTVLDGWVHAIATHPNEPDRMLAAGTGGVLQICSIEPRGPVRK